MKLQTKRYCDLDTNVHLRHPSRPSGGLAIIPFCRKLTVCKLKGEQHITSEESHRGTVCCSQSISPASQVHVAQQDVHRHHPVSSLLALPLFNASYQTPMASLQSWCAAERPTSAVNALVLTVASPLSLPHGFGMTSYGRVCCLAAWQPFDWCKPAVPGSAMKRNPTQRHTMSPVGINPA